MVKLVKMVKVGFGDWSMAMGHFLLEVRLCICEDLFFFG